MKKLFAALLLFVFISAPAFARPATEAELAPIEEYLNSLTTLQADFIQSNDEGQTARGELLIKRPGKMRLQYAGKNASLLVADGTALHLWDGEMKNATSAPLQSSLAWLILRAPVKLSGDLTVTDYQKDAGVVEVSVVETANPKAGQLTLVFSTAPMALRQWRVVDAQGFLTRVGLQNVRLGEDLPNKNFVFVDPRFLDGDQK